MPRRSLRQSQRLERDFCFHILRYFLRSRREYVKPFRRPIDPDEDEAPDYYDVIQNPMDLSTMRRRIVPTAEEYLSAFELIFENCFRYYRSESHVYKLGQKFRDAFHKHWSTKEDWIAQKTTKYDFKSMFGLHCDQSEDDDGILTDDSHYNGHNEQSGSRAQQSTETPATSNDEEMRDISENEKPERKCTSTKSSTPSAEDLTIKNEFNDHSLPNQHSLTAPPNPTSHLNQIINDLVSQEMKALTNEIDTNTNISDTDRETVAWFWGGERGKLTSQMWKTKAMEKVETMRVQDIMGDGKVRKKVENAFVEATRESLEAQIQSNRLGIDRFLGRLHDEWGGK